MVKKKLKKHTLCNKFTKSAYLATFWAGGKGHPEIFHFLPLNTLIQVSL
jgi:hypothetical protein